MNRTMVNMLGFNADIDAGAEDLVSAGGTYAFPTAARVHAIISDNANDSNAQRASATITVVDYTQLAGKVLTVNGTALTEGVEWTAAVSNNATADSLAAAIDALANFIAANPAAAAITAYYVTGGTAGNAATLATSDATNLTISGALFTGGNAGGTGARKVVVEGLSALGAFLRETVNLDGDFAAVNTVNSYYRINRLYVSEAGSGGTNAGIITATAATDGTVSARIAVGDAEDVDAVYTVPANFKLVFDTAIFTVTGSGTSVIFDILVKDSATAAWRSVARAVAEVGGGPATLPPLLLNAVKAIAGADVKVRGTSSGANSSASCMVTGRLLSTLAPAT